MRAGSLLPTSLSADDSCTLAKFVCTLNVSSILARLPHTAFAPCGGTRVFADRERTPGYDDVYTVDGNKPLVPEARLLDAAGVGVLATGSTRA